jgi:glutaredoxin-like protein NrdH
MFPITVSTKRACVRAMFTFHALDRAKPPTPPVSTSRKLCLMRHANSGEYLCVPVVYAGPDNHFAGFRPDRLRPLNDSTAA